MRRSRGLALALLASIAGVAVRAEALECPNPLVSTCIQSDTFWPHAGPAGRLTYVGGTETVASGQIGFGLSTTYLSRPIVLHVASPGPTGTDQYAVDNQVNGNFLWSYGVSNRLEIDFALPITFRQSGGGKQPITGGDALKDTALRDLRFGLAYAIVPRERVPAEETPSLWSLTARMELSAPTGDRDQFAGEGAAVFMPSLAGDIRYGRFFAGAETGFRVRRTAELVGARVGTQWTAGLGAGFVILPRDLLSAALEARTLYTFAEQANAQQTSQGLVSQPNGLHIMPAEWMLSVHSSPLLDGDLGLELGGGGALPFTQDAPITTPRFRFVLGVRYAPLGRPKPKPAPAPTEAPASGRPPTQ
jgi:hypothetical protein